MQHPAQVPASGRYKSLKVLLMQNFQTAASVLKHRLPHSAKPHPRILPQRGINMKYEKTGGRNLCSLLPSVFTSRCLTASSGAACSSIYWSVPASARPAISLSAPASARLFRCLPAFPPSLSAALLPASSLPLLRRGPASSGCSGQTVSVPVQ